MKADTENFSAQQSLDLITSMILEAKGNLRRNNFFFLFWGWIVVTANIGMFVLDKLEFKHPYAVWLITIPAWIFTLVKAFSSKKVAATKTHLERISGWLWMSFGISIFVLVAFGWRINYQLNPVILTVSAIPTLVSGIVLKFKPLLWGAVAFWIGGIASFIVALSFQPLVGAVTIVFGYLIPGYLLNTVKGN